MTMTAAVLDHSGAALPVLVVETVSKAYLVNDGPGELTDIVTSHLVGRGFTPDHRGRHRRPDRRQRRVCDRHHRSRHRAWPGGQLGLGGFFGPKGRDRPCLRDRFGPVVKADFVGLGHDSGHCRQVFLSLAPRFSGPSMLGPSLAPLARGIDLQAKDDSF